MARADDAKVRVRIDTKQAKADLEGLTKSARTASERVGGRIRREVGRGLGMFSIGAATGIAVNTLTASTQSGFGAVVGETFTSLGAQLEEFFLGDLGVEARSKRSARDSVIQAFSAVTGAQGAVPPQAKQWFEQVRALRQVEEQGRRLIMQDKDFSGPGIGAVIDRVIAKLGEEIKAGFKSLADLLNPFF